MIERNCEIERQNKLLFDKIESIIQRPGPFKVQHSKNNVKKLAKVFHAPSDQTIVASTYIPRPSYNMTTVAREKRQRDLKELQRENLKVLDRIRDSKPTIDIGELQQWERKIKKRKRLLESQFEKAKHGYIAREPHEEVHIPMLPSVSTIMDTDRTSNNSFLMNTLRSNPSKH